MAKLLEINDSIHRTVERYKLIKKGDVEAASKIPKGTLGTSTGVGKNAANELSLIDFDPEPDIKNGTTAAVTGPKATAVEDDLLGLSIGDRASGMISLGFGANSGVPGPPLLSSTMQQSSAASPTSSTSFPSQQTARPKYDAFSSVTSRPSSKPASPSPMQQQQRQKPVSAPQVPADPFAALVAPNARSSSPFNQPPPAKPNPGSSTLLDLADSPSQAEFSGQNGTVTDDEWNFASSLPENTLPASQRVEVHSSSVRIEFLTTRLAGQESIRILAQFSNNTAQTIHGLHFQVAVEKVGRSRRAKSSCRLAHSVDRVIAFS